MNNDRNTSPVTEQDLEKINRYTRRPMKAEELYTFTVVLCDNDVDRDYERFTIDALQKLAELFLGKTGIFDHSAKTEHQSARIFDTWLEEDDSRTTEAGEVYTRLAAKAYLPRSEKNEQLMLEIDSGMKKEVSVGCSMAKRVCSICGADKTKQHCDHHKGRTYSIHGVEKRAHDILSEPTDAYEWSFVAVPAQRKAGVVKQFAQSGGSIAIDVEKLFSGDLYGEVLLTKEAVMQLKDHMEALKQQAESGSHYRDAAEKEIRRLGRMAYPEIVPAVMDRILKESSPAELESLRKAYKRRINELQPMHPQLWREQTEQTASAEHLEFKI